MADARAVLHRNPDHVSILVPDIADGMRRYSELLGLSWGTPMGARSPVEIDGERHELDFASVYSRGEGLHIELSQAIPGTLWDRPEGLHHIGFWSDDVPGESAALEAAGYRIVARFTPEPGAQPVMTLHALPGGTYLQLADEAQLGPIITKSWAD